MKNLSKLAFGLIVILGVACQNNKPTTETIAPIVDAAAAAAVTTMVDTMKMDSTGKAQMDTSKTGHAGHTH